MSLALYLIAIIAYVSALSMLYVGIFKRRSIVKHWILALSFTGGALHLIACFTTMISSQGVDLSLFRSGSLIFALMVVLISISSIRRPSHSLLFFIQPAAILFIILSLFTQSTKVAEISGGVAAHVLLSILAYGVITIAACCALALYYVNYRLKHKRTGASLSMLPPLETIDKLLFEMILAGEVLLTLSIVSGFLFIDDFFAQRLAHKTFFSLISWCIFGFLIIGHYRFGWRGSKAIKWTIAGFLALLLAYAGSKFVIEWVLASPLT